MYTKLADIHQRPEPFSVYTADVLWTEPHLSQQMLHYHLSQDTDLASRQLSTIDSVVDWIDQKFDLKGKNVCDLGCGPGLYTQRFAARGAHVLGLDFSANSISHAQKTTPDVGLTIEYRVANYLKDPLPSSQDLITMIYCDLCALSPRQRQVIYQKVRHALRPGGAFLFDVMSTKAFDARDESSTYGRGFMGGFWAEGDYFTFLNTFKYDAEKVTLDQYTVVEAHRTWQVFNWLQYFDSSDITTELAQNGFDAVEIAYDFANPSGSGDGTHFGVIAKPVT
ncbi:MAG: class I SAM-dependent methyltransferase [Gammaproteobacteria bacterium]|nr:class I SAM-dependent methyltransferase [Gammaproteobacteria bacterium]